MKKLVCEMCGGQDLIKQDGVFVCQNCGTKYSVEEARKMMVEGTVSIEGTVAVEGTVKVDKSEELKNLYVLARRAKEMDNSENAGKYYNEIVLKDPDNWEANFYLVYYKAASCKKGQIGNEAYNVTNCLRTTIKLLVESLGTGQEAKKFILEVKEDLAKMAGPMIHGAMDVSEYGYIGQILMMQETLGSCLSEYPELKDLAIDSWKELISTYIKYAAFGKANLDHVGLYGYSPEHAVQLIYDIDPSYEDPFGITKKLRKNEKFITCPVCGKSIRERDTKCPQCGTNKEEIQRLIKEKQAKEATERERLRKEAEAKAAEEARIRAEKRAEWWKKNKKTVLIVLAIIALAIGVGIIIKFVADRKLEQKISAIIEEGDQCVNAYAFEEAENHYHLAMEMDNSDETKNKVYNKLSQLSQAKQNADEEYENALKKLRILLDADDYVFNHYSNECLDKMIQIYPEREETKYYKNLRK